MRAARGRGSCSRPARRATPERRQYRDLRAGAHAGPAPGSGLGERAPTHNPRHPATSNAARRADCAVASATGSTSTPIPLAARPRASPARRSSRLSGDVEQRPRLAPGGKRAAPAARWPPSTSASRTWRRPAREVALDDERRAAPRAAAGRSRRGWRARASARRRRGRRRRGASGGPARARRARPAGGVSPSACSRRSSSPAPRASAGQWMREAGVPWPVRAQPVDVASRRAARRGRPAVAASGRASSRPTTRTRSVRGSTSSSSCGRRAAAHRAGEPERVAHDQRGRLAACAGRGGRTGPRPGRSPSPRRSIGDSRPLKRHRHPGERIAELAAGQSRAAPRDLDRRLQRLVLDDAVGEWSWRSHARAARGELDPGRRRQRAEQRERDARDEQRRGVEQQREQRAATSPEPATPAAGAAMPRTRAPLTAPAPRTPRRR